MVPALGRAGGSGKTLASPMGIGALQGAFPSAGAHRKSREPSMRTTRSADAETGGTPIVVSCGRRRGREGSDRRRRWLLMPRRRMAGKGH
ncbi:hypothetical protein NL676_016297 [Syzygium grande]|nr:hypothetical protein NL676_016297 [Syzygium grande]